MIPAVIALLALGLAIGVFSGLLGIGGGMVMVPAFRLLFNMAPLASTATSLFTIVPTSISGAVTHIRNRTCAPKLGLALGLGGACTSPLGVFLASVSPPWLVMLAAAAVIAYSAINMFRKAAKAPKSPAHPSPETKPATAVNASAPPAPLFAVSGRHLAIGAAIGLIAGLASGYVGVGGGFIMVPLMLSLIGIPMKLASGTSLIAVMILALPGAIEQGLIGNIDFLAGVVCACGTIPGASLGARLTKRIPERRLRFLFGGFLLAAAALLLIKEIGLQA